MSKDNKTANMQSSTNRQAWGPNSGDRAEVCSTFAKGTKSDDGGFKCQICEKKPHGKSYCVVVKTRVKHYRNGGKRSIGEEIVKELTVCKQCCYRLTTPD